MSEMSPVSAPLIFYKMGMKEKLLDYVKWTLNDDAIVTHNSLMNFCQIHPEKAEQVCFLIAQRAIDGALEAESTKK
jgi:hypothetical protein